MLHHSEGCNAWTESHHIPYFQGLCWCPAVTLNTSQRSKLVTEKQDVMWTRSLKKRKKPSRYKCSRDFSLHSPSLWSGMWPRPVWSTVVRGWSVRGFSLIGQLCLAARPSSLSGPFAAQSLSLAHRMQSLLSGMSWRIIICKDHGRWSVPQPARQYLHEKRGRGNKSTNWELMKSLKEAERGGVNY